MRGRLQTLDASAPDIVAAWRGEWLLFAGVHDLMHLEQLERLEANLP